MTSVWSAWSVDTVTGLDKCQVPVKAFPWDRMLSAGATTTIRIPMDEFDVSRTMRRDLTEEWKRTIYLKHTSGVVFAGIVTGRDYDRDARDLVLDLTDLWGLWARRGAWDHSAGNVQLWSLAHTDATLSLLAKRAVERGTTNLTTPDIELPLTLPADDTGTIDRTIYGYHLEFVHDILDDLMEEGLDLDFRPREATDDLFDWSMIIPDPDPTLWEWTVTADAGGVANFHARTDGSRMTNNAVVVGEGAGEEMLVRSNRSLTSDLPLLERVEARKTISDEDQLVALANQMLAKYEEPTSSWSFEIDANGSPAVGELRLGDLVRLQFANDPWLTDGFYTRRIVRLQGDLGNKVTVSLQPTGGA